MLTLGQDSYVRLDNVVDELKGDKLKDNDLYWGYFMGQCDRYIIEISLVSSN